jgi:maltose O-acetyltransferase
MTSLIIRKRRARMRTEKQKMLAGELYRPGDPEIQADLAATRAWLARYNASLARSSEERHELLAERLAEVGPGTVIRPPFHCDYGFNIHLGSNVFLNFNCVILDVVEVTIADGAQIGPAVQIYAADHPRDPAQRREGLEFGRPVRIGRDRRWRDHSAGCRHRRRRRHRCGQRGNTRCAGGRHRFWQPCAAEDLN